MLDRRGRPRTPATLSGAGKGRVAINKGKPFGGPNPFSVTELSMLLGAMVPQRPGSAAVLSAERLKASFIVMYRTGLRVSEMLDLEPRDLRRTERKVTVRNGKGAKRRTVRMDDWGWGHLGSWIELRQSLPHPTGSVFCVISGPTAGLAMSASDVRRQLAKVGNTTGLGRRFNPHSCRHSFACDLDRSGFTLEQIRRALGHESLDTTQAYLRGLGEDEVLNPIGMRAGPMMPLMPLA